MRWGASWFFLAGLMIATAGAASAGEVCGNGADDDGNGLTDEACYPSMSTACESPLACSDSGWVSWSTGSLHYDLPPDVAPKSPYGHAITFRRFYTSMYTPGAAPTSVNRAPLGPRWQHNFMSWINLPAGNVGTTSAVLHTTDGRDLAFMPSWTDGAWMYYSAQKGNHFQYLRRRSDGVEFQLRTLLGDTIVYDAAGRMIEVWDAVADPNTNKIRIAYTAPAGGNVDTVTDATGARRLRFAYANDLLTAIDFQLKNAGVWTTYHTTTYGYAGGALATVTIGGQLAQTNAYAGGNLTQIVDGDGKQIVAFQYAAPGVVAVADTENGTLGFEFGSSRNECSGQTVVYFNKGNAQSCSADADCGSGFLCGGKNGSAGTCFRAARCLTVDASSGESLVTAVKALGPPSEQCTGACAEVTQYAWNTLSLDLQATKDALGSFTSVRYDANGMPVKILYGDNDADASSGGQKAVYLFYDAVYPGRLREVRRPTVMDPWISPQYCSDTNTGGCAQTFFQYDYATGKLAKTTQHGYTLDGTGELAEYDYATSFTYDTRGRITQIDGPLTNSTAPYGDYDVTTFNYPPYPDPIRDGFAYNATYYTSTWTSYAEYPTSYDFWGNPTSWVSRDGAGACQTFDPARGFLTATSQSASGWLCSVDDPNNLTERYARDSALRLTRTTHADGSCTHYEYDARGRLARVKSRDDCNPASAGDRDEYLYDADGLVTEVDTYDQAGVVRKKELRSYHDSRRPARVMNPADPTKYKAMTYDERGELTQVDDEAGLGKTVYAVDALRRLMAVTRYKTATTSDTWTMLRNWFDKVFSVTDPDGKVLQTRYDDLGRMVRYVSPDQTTTMFTSNSYTAHRRMSTSSTLSNVKRFTYDSVGRLLTADYPGQCNSTSGPEIVQSYDHLPQGVSCPLAGGCLYYNRLVYSKVSLLCNINYADGSLDQETFYAYDFAGRVTEEYIRDDSGRIADHRYAWDKGGNLTQTTLPSGAVLGTTYGSTGSNSDADLPAALWRTSAATPIIDNIQWNPGGVLKQYNRFDTIAGIGLRMKIDYDLAYRPTLVKLDGQTGGGPYYYLQLSLDAKGRVTKRDYYPSDPQIPGIFDSYFLYDQQDRVLCETASYAATCPASGAAIKNNLAAGFTGAGDRKTLLRPIAGSAGGLTHVFNLAPGTHRLASVDQTDGAPALGSTTYSYNNYGNRTADNNTNPATHLDSRTVSYDARDNVTVVQGAQIDPYTGAAVSYVVRSAFDAKDRRVFKSYWTPSAEAQWFFYYDALDRLAEVRYTPNISTPAVYTTYQLIWLDDLLVAYWQTDQPSGTTSKRYVEFDETGRPVRMHSWLPGNSMVSWAINPDAWGDDRAVIGAGVYQPIVFAGQYQDAETAAYLDDLVTVHRPGLVLNGHRTYDPFTGSYLQLDPMVKDTWSPYAYADGNPVGESDPTGLATKTCIAWTCGGAGGNGSVIEVSCTCSQYEQPANFDFPRGHDGGNRPGGRDPGDRAGGGGRSGGRGTTPSRGGRTQPQREERAQPQSDDWWQQCQADIQEGFDPKYGGRVIERAPESPISGSGSGRSNFADDGLLRLGPAARFLPGEHGVDYSGYDWVYRGRFCQLLSKTLDHVNAGGF